MEKIIGIYKITNKINGKIYIGQSKNIYKRWFSHKETRKREKYKNVLLYKAMNKYGIENFDFEIIEICDEELLNEKEIFYIEKYGSFSHGKNKGYNQTLGGGGGYGFVFSEERLQKARDAATGKNNGMYGKKHSKESKLKMREKRLNKKLSDSAKQKIGEANKNKIVSEETRKKLSEAGKNRNFDISNGKNPRAIKVYCDGVWFDCIKECALYYNVNKKTMGDWLIGKSPMPQKFIDMGLKRIK